jgi:hypothetical protein
MLMTQFIVGLLLLFLLSGCGRPETTITENELVYPTSYRNTPIFLKLQNKQCLSNTFTPSQTFYNLHLFLEGETSNQTHDFSPMLQGLFLRNGSVVADSLYGEKIEIFEKSKAYLRARPSSIKLCPDEDGYLPETVESAALNTTYFINKSHLRFTTVVSDVAVSPITLNISPAIIDSKVEKDFNGELSKKSEYRTDNAFYMPRARSITFLPHSIEMRSLGMNTNYWEVPFVASHEYGHHLFEMIYKDSQSLGPETVNCFGHSKQTTPKSNLNKSLNRKVKIDDVLNSYNEAFADLMAWYTLDPKERDVKGVKCLEISRDITSPTLINGKPKVFNKEALQAFFSNYIDNSFRSCEVVSYQDTHILGAIFAHNADLFLSELTSSDDEKLQAVVAWTKELKAEKKKYLLASAETFLKETVTLFMRMSLERFDRRFDVEICNKIYKVYPELNIKECSVKKDL